ncbi:unnamed protein product [Bursaphelenchus okinawaensis]|uniref:Nuclear receptor domain-containing protein n=1 Tax=Bursaphelenchus okinawaensis TaxID=465554 RepID=A0A811KT97_9BILA|nr:unnamed protein product [Bursaphelenchus okinawaensis]CAG9109711.1 unnamed protein product [Bursaphelenchus okinawaensis]
MDSDAQNESDSQMPSSSTSQSVHRNSIFSCKVCGAPSHGELFGVIVCRACGAFFRRTVAEHKVYKCNHPKRHSIDTKARNFCRKCRYDKCLAVGMQAEKVQLIRDKNRNTITTTPTKRAHRSLTQTSLPPTPNEISSVLGKLMDGYEFYKNARNSVFAGWFPEYTFSDQTAMIEIPIYEKLTLDKALIPNLYLMHKNYFCSRYPLDPSVKKEVVRGFLEKFVNFEKAYLTSIHFPDKNDKRIANSNSHYIVFDNVKFDANGASKEMNQTFMPYSVRLKRFSQKVTTLKLDETEFIAVMGIVNCENIHNLTGSTQANEDRDTLFYELHCHCQQKQSQSASVRYGQIMLMLRDLEYLSLAFMECMYIGIVSEDLYKSKVDSVRGMLERVGIFR